MVTILANKQKKMIHILKKVNGDRKAIFTVPVEEVGGASVGSGWSHRKVGVASNKDLSTCTSN